jgi:hypothetical protein
VRDLQISAHQRASVEAVFHELLREILDQFGIRRRVAGADVVDRLHDADAEQVTPERD